VTFVVKFSVFKILRLAVPTALPYYYIKLQF